MSLDVSITEWCYIIIILIRHINNQLLPSRLFERETLKSKLFEIVGTLCPAHRKEANIIITHFDTHTHTHTLYNKSTIKYVPNMKNALSNFITCHI